MDKPAPVQRPTKAQRFLFSVPVSTPVDAIIDSNRRSPKMAAKGSLLLANKVVPLERAGTPVVYVTVYRLPPCVSDDVLTAALAPYGKCRGISDVVFKDRTDISNGSRLVKLEMVKPPPNFIMVTGFRVMLEYKGMKRVCSKCGAEVAPAMPAQPAFEDNAPEGTAQTQTNDQPEEESAPEVPTPASAGVSDAASSPSTDEESNETLPATMSSSAAENDEEPSLNAPLTRSQNGFLHVLQHRTLARTQMDAISAPPKSWQAHRGSRRLSRQRL
ncbi:hypothetical protein HPB49_014373 [Dermacentor silvarum]|uniref:Uncharacterized protein n=1 Tax=Dermacentor silvarum TaxID=543639 RepID=A0ACB8C432_DERSI|nr:hypothetical protein HPB49_014373 [Dermacentor silvarum]